SIYSMLLWVPSCLSQSTECYCWCLLALLRSIYSVVLWVLSCLTQINLLSVTVGAILPYPDNLLNVTAGAFLPYPINLLNVTACAFLPYPDQSSQCYWWCLPTLTRSTYSMLL
ncbi:hypothetical protein NDU88_008229, partial [Pleurodeles waltl]